MSSESTDKWAYQIAVNAGTGLIPALIQYALTVARGEGYYGLGWGSGAGAGSNNWGAVQGTGDAGYFEHIDHHADGSEYTTKFKKYSTPEKGFADMARILFGGGIRGSAGAKEITKAIKSGKLKDAVYAQRANGYYELAADKYLAAVKKNYDTLTANLKWPKLLYSNIWFTIGQSLIGLGLGISGIYVYRNIKHGSTTKYG